MSASIIYTLADPVTGEIRYVGKTSNPKGRLQNHCCARESLSCLEWLKSLRAKKLKPIMEALEEVGDDWQEQERFWISYLRFLGCPLVNMDSGGVKGKTLSLTHRAKLSRIHTGKKLTPEHIAKATACLWGRKVSAETRQKMSAASKGKPKSEAHRLKLRGLKIGTKHSAKTRAKMSASHHARLARLRSSVVVPCESAATPQNAS